MVAIIYIYIHEDKYIGESCGGLGLLQVVVACPFQTPFFMLLF